MISYKRRDKEVHVPTFEELLDILNHVRVRDKDDTHIDWDTKKKVLTINRISITRIPLGKLIEYNQYINDELKLIDEEIRDRYHKVRKQPLDKEDIELFLEKLIDEYSPRIQELISMHTHIATWLRDNGVPKKIIKKYFPLYNIKLYHK